MTETGPSTRIALVIGQLTVGGAEGQLRELVRHLDRRFLPTVYCLADSPAALRADLESMGVALRTIGSRGFGRARRLARQLRADRIDLVHAWLFIANAYALGARLCGARQPLITSARNCKMQGRLSQLVNVMAFRCSRAIVVNSHDVAAYVTAHYWAPRARLRVIENGIDITRFQPGKAGDGPIVTVGRLVVQKNHSLFLQAAARLAVEMPAARFVIVGDGPLRASLEAQAHSLGIASRLTFAGERRDVDAILHSASLFWLTSRWEGMPNVVLEALASGVPVIATDVGGTRALIRNGIDGFVVPADDAAAFVRHSVALLRDPVLRDSVGAAARSRAEAFSSDRMASNFARLYDDVLQREA